MTTLRRSVIWREWWTPLKYLSSLTEMDPRCSLPCRGDPPPLQYAVSSFPGTIQYSSMHAGSIQETQSVAPFPRSFVDVLWTCVYQRFNGPRENVQFVCSYYIGCQWRSEEEAQAQGWSFPLLERLSGSARFIGGLSVIPSKSSEC